MGCLYENNPFCSSLNPKTKERLCHVCHIRMEKAGQNILPHMPVLVLDGLLVSYGAVSGNDSMKCVMLIPKGLFTNLTSLWNDDYTKWTLYGAKTNFTNTTLAYFDLATVRQLFTEDPDFAKELYRQLADTQRIMADYSNTLIFLKAKDILRFVLTLCHDAGITYLTHEQLATLTNLNRSTVTQLMKEILREG